MCAVVSSVYKKSQGECGFNVIDVLIGFDVAEERMRSLLQHCNRILSGKVILLCYYLQYIVEIKL